METSKITQLRTKVNISLINQLDCAMEKELVALSRKLGPTEELSYIEMLEICLKNVMNQHFIESLDSNDGLFQKALFNFCLNNPKYEVLSD